ncbi:MAG: Uma2 family endonuclease [Candidatus Xenobia bacterium]
MTLPHPRLTPEEYLKIERQAERKSEFYNGEMFAMAGASRRHEQVKMNIAAELHSRLKGRPCDVYSSDMRVKVNATGLYTYPDVAALCGEGQFEDAEVDTLLNPSVIVEVLSPSTEAYDRGGKFANYRQVPSITDYVLAAQDRMSVEHYARQPDGSWLLHAYERPEDDVEIGSLGVRLPLAEIYARVKLPEVPSLKPADRPASPEAFDGH